MPLTRAPSSPRSPRAARRVTRGPTILLLPPTPVPRQMGHKQPGVWRLRPRDRRTQPSSPIGQPGASAGLLSTGAGAGQPWAAGTAVDKFLAPRSVPWACPYPPPHREAWQLGDPRAGESKDPGPPHPRQCVLEGPGPLPEAPEVDRQPLRGNAACPTAPGLPWAASHAWPGRAF